MSTDASRSLASIADPELRAFLPGFEAATRAFMDGDATLWKQHVSRRDDVLIMGAWGDHEQGWPAVSARYDWACARFRKSGATLEVEYLVAVRSGDLASTTAIERAFVLLAGQEQLAAMALRVTHLFRREEDGWKLVLRHADPLVSKTATEAVLQR
jgi:ketosteroid isomerase-like protein